MVEYARTAPTLHDHWPEPDRAAWIAAMRISGDFDEPGKGANWSRQSRENVERAYDQYLRTLARHGMLDATNGVAGRYDLTAIKQFYYDRLERVRASTAWANLQALARAFAAMAPDLDLSDLYAVLSRIKARTPLSRSFDTPLPTPKELIEIGARLMAEAEQMRVGANAAIRFRNGTMIQAATYIPLRGGMWASVALNKNFKLNAEVAVLSFEAEQTKSKRQPVEIRIPEKLAKCLRRYCSAYRPFLIKNNRNHGDLLWLSQLGGPLSLDGFATAISSSVSSQLGRKFTTHMFRHAAASFVADVAPDQARLVAGLLTHAGLETAEQHYVKGQRGAAARAYHALVEEIIDSKGMAL